MLGFVAVRGDQVGTARQAVDGDFAFPPAAYRTDFFALGGQNRFGGRFSQIGQVANYLRRSLQEHLGLDGHPQPQVVVVVLSGLEHDLYGHALDDFHVVARSIFRREQA